jgi:predicted transcriptional regulator
MDRELMVIGNEVRDLERKTLADDKASDTECAATARALFEQKKRESDVELKYFDRLADVLTPRQLIKLKSAERKIAMQLANYHGRQQKARRAPADKK